MNLHMAAYILRRFRALGFGGFEMPTSKLDPYYPKKKKGSICLCPTTPRYLERKKDLFYINVRNPIPKKYKGSLTLIQKRENHEDGIKPLHLGGAS